MKSGESICRGGVSSMSRPIVTRVAGAFLNETRTEVDINLSSGASANSVLGLMNEGRVHGLLSRHSRTKLFLQFDGSPLGPAAGSPPRRRVLLCSRGGGALDCGIRLCA